MVSRLAAADEPARPEVEIPPDLEWKIEYSRALLSAMPESSVMVVGSDERILLADGKLLERHGYPASALAGRRLDEVLPPSTGGMLRERYRAALRGSVESFDYETTDGRICWIQLSPLYAGGERPSAVTAVIQDMTERMRMTAELTRERELRLGAEEVAGVGHWEADPVEGIVTLSEGTLRLLGLEREGRLPIGEVLDHMSRSDRRRLSAHLAEGEESWEFECDLHLPGAARRRVLIRGHRRADADGRELITGTMIDITELRAAEQARTESESLFLQGFNNSPIGMAIVTPDEKRFLRVNDALCRLLQRGREDLVGSLCAEVTHPDDLAADEAARAAMLAAQRTDYECEKRYIRPDGSIVWGSLHVSPVYSASGEIRAFFSQIVDLTTRKEREAELLQEAADVERLAELRGALAGRRLVLHAQPIIELATGEVVQHELLVRLRREDGEIVMPGEFLPVAERHGYITAIDQWVVREAVELAAEGRPVEVNLSAASVGDGTTLATIRAALEETGADPSLLVFEVTETALMQDIDRGRSFAEALRALGCRFALDDFGTGYGTFTYLKHIPIDYLKIDIDFVRDVAVSEADERLVRAIVTMARDLGKQTIAEGVEDAAALARLRELGVDHAQGYHLGAPGPVFRRDSSRPEHAPGARPPAGRPPGTRAPGARALVR